MLFTKLKNKFEKRQVEDDALVVDLFQESQHTGGFLKENIESIVSELSEQFEDPEDCQRELIQNSLDSNTPQIDAYTSTKKLSKSKRLFFSTVEDYGDGMNFDEKGNFFLKLFSSSKEKDLKKIGQYGIGISSVFALNLKDLWVESCGTSNTGEKESWGLHIMDIDGIPKYAYYDLEENTTTGTKITLSRVIDRKEIEPTRKKFFDKINFYCQRHKTPIYVDKKFINKPFDLGSKIKLSQNTSELEFVLSIGGDDLGKFELFNNRLKLQEGYSLFPEYPEVSCLICSPYFKHTFSRDSVKQDENYEKVLSTVQKSIGGLFLKSLETIDYHMNNPIPDVYSEEISISVPYNAGYQLKIDSTYMLGRVKEDIEEQIKRPNYKLFKEDLEIVEKKYNLAKEKLEEKYKILQEHSNSIRKRDREFNAAWKFTGLWMDKIITKVKKKRKDTSFRSFFSPNSFYEHIKTNLPIGAAKHKVIRTIGKDYSINEILDVLKSEDKLYFLHKRNSKLEKLLKNDGKTIFLDSQGTYTSVKEASQKTLLKSILCPSENDHMDSKYINATTKYAISLKLNEDKLEKSEALFLELLKKNLPIGIKAKISDLYFTNNSVLGYSSPKSLFFRAPSGKIDLGSPKKSFRKKIREEFINLFYQQVYDVAINLDHDNIQKIISIGNLDDPLAKELAVKTINESIVNEFPMIIRNYNGGTSIVRPHQNDYYIGGNYK
jgi:hypothetical protein